MLTAISASKITAAELQTQCWMTTSLTQPTVIRHTTPTTTHVKTTCRTSIQLLVDNNNSDVLIIVGVKRNLRKKETLALQWTAQVSR